MSDTQRRVLGGVCLLAGLWVLVYWLWQPSRGAIRFDRASPDAPPGEAGALARNEPSPAANQPARGDHPPQSSPPGEPASSLPAIRDPLSEQRVPPPADQQGLPMRPSPPSQTARFRDYTIRSGDTFERIAERELGARSRVADVVAANPGKDPRRLRIGDVIRLPVDPASPIVVAPGASPGSSPPAAPPATPTPAGPGQPAAGSFPTTYTVARGDSLSAISQRIYGTVRHATLIFEANRDTLRSADDIREGQVLRIPPPPQ